jgi:glycolate oxidase iron-sulfur subunit
MNYNGSDNSNDHRNPAAGISSDLFLRCIHCGLCTSSCPTYAEVGDENDGPRGRIQLMQMVADGRTELSARMRRHLDLCLDCRACETACPSGVRYGQMIVPFRLGLAQDESRPERKYDWFRRLILLGLVPYAERMRRLLVPIRMLQQTGLIDAAERLGLLKLIPGRLGQLISLLPPPVRPGPKLPRFLPAVGRKRARVALFVGCVADALFRQTHWATARVLQQNGCDVFIPPEQGCCGALHLQAGDSRGARRMADANLVAFELDRYDAILVNHAGCGAMLKEYGLHWRDGLQPHRQKFAAKVRDVHEFIDTLGMIRPQGRIEKIATYHDACRLAHAQGITSAPRRLLAKVPGLELRPLPESDVCCGSAGAYGLAEVEMSERLAERKIENLRRTGAQIVLAADAGCLLQIQRQLRRNKLPLRAMHTMDLLDLSYRGEAPSND